MAIFGICCSRSSNGNRETCEHRPGGRFGDLSDRAWAVIPSVRDGEVRQDQGMMEMERATTAQAEARLQKGLRSTLARRPCPPQKFRRQSSLVQMAEGRVTTQNRLHFEHSSLLKAGIP